MSKRQYIMVEERYLAEYVGKFFPNARKVFFQVPVSAKPWMLAGNRTDVSPRWFYRFGPRIDAVVIDNGHLILIEAETRRPVIGLSELEVYANEYRNSLQLRPYVDLPLRVQLVTPIWDEHVAKIMASRGWEYVMYCPDWIRPHLRRWRVIE